MNIILVILLSFAACLPLSAAQQSKTESYVHNNNVGQQCDEQGFYRATQKALKIIKKQQPDAKKATRLHNFLSNHKLNADSFKSQLFHAIKRDLIEVTMVLIRHGANMSDVYAYSNLFKREKLPIVVVAKEKAERKQKIDQYDQEVVAEQKKLHAALTAALPHAGWQDTGLIISEYVSKPFFENLTQAEQRKILFPPEAV
jgi:hypothetical protein